MIFFKTLPAIDPVDFVHRICEEIVANPKIRRMKYINRLTPMTLFGKATERGLEEVSKTILGKYFQLNKPGDGGEVGGNGDQDQQSNETPHGQTNYSVRAESFNAVLLLRFCHDI